MKKSCSLHHLGRYIETSAISDSGYNWMWIPLRINHDLVYIFSWIFTAVSTFPKSRLLLKSEWPGFGNFCSTLLSFLLRTITVLILTYAWVTPRYQFHKKFTSLPPTPEASRNVIKAEHKSFELCVESISVHWVILTARLPSFQHLLANCSNITLIDRVDDRYSLLGLHIRL